MKNGEPTPSPQLFIGNCEMEINQALKLMGSAVDLTLAHDKMQAGNLTYTATNFVESHDLVNFNFRLEPFKNQKASFFSCFDVYNPYLKLYRKSLAKNGKEEEWTLFRSTQIDRDDNYLVLRVSEMCECDYNQSIRFVVSNEFDSSSQVQTSMQISLNSLLHQQMFSFDDSISRLHIDNAHITKIDNYLDIINSGLEINLEIAIDFSMYNGDVLDPDNLHSLDKNSKVKNNYYKCLESVANILIPYDTDKIIPVYGLNYENDNVFHPFYQINGVDVYNTNTNKNLEGVRSAYINFFKYHKIKFGSPNNLAPLLNHLNKKVSKEPINQYYILLIFTNGQISDFNKTIEAVVESSSYAISIVMVGVGDQDFSLMSYLDSDEERITDQLSRVQKRDNLQFVNYNQCRNHADLKKQVLEELPIQIEDYFSFKKLMARDIKEYCSEDKDVVGFFDDI